METAAYDKDVILWSQEQARLLRAGQFAHLDIEHLADEIEDVGKSEKREFANRIGVLLAHLLKWQHQPERRAADGPSLRSWANTIRNQRERIALAIKATPSLKASLRDPDWRRLAWLDAVEQAASETGLDESEFGEACPWPMEQVMAPGFLPD